MHSAADQISDADVCQAFLEAWIEGHRRFPDVILMDRTGKNWHTCREAIQRAKRAGLVEGDVANLRGGKLTEKGTALLKLALQGSGVRDQES